MRNTGLRIILTLAHRYRTPGFTPGTEYPLPDLRFGEIYRTPDGPHSGAEFRFSPWRNDTEPTIRFVKEVETSNTEKACATNEWLTSFFKSGSKVVLYESLPLSATPDAKFTAACIEGTEMKSLKSERRRTGRQPDA